MRHVKYAILGGGPTGLGAGYRLKELKQADFLIIERSRHVGGLASSFVDTAGFTWDIGGHVQFSHYDYFDQVMERALGADGWLRHQRESWAWMHDQFVPYPVQNNIRYLPKDFMWQCLEGLIEASLAAKTTPQNFRDWILATCGPGLATTFMFPYNFKVWAFPPEMMACDWVGERVAVPDVKRITKNILFALDDLSWGPNNTFQFPKHGGTGAIWRRVADLIGSDKILLDQTVQSVNSAQRLLTLESGEQIRFEKLLSTIPVDLLCKMITPAPSDSVLLLSQKLLHSTSHIVGIGLKGQPPDSLRTKCWMYFPEDNCPFYRTTVFSNYSPYNVPDTKSTWSLMTETSESSRKPVRREQIIEAAVQGCINTKLIRSRSEVVSTWLYSAEYGYPTPSLERSAILAKVLPSLEQREIFSRGRFGGWKYEVSNQDHALMQGVEWANLVELNEPEMTLPFPNVVNAGKSRARSG